MVWCLSGRILLAVACITAWWLLGASDCRAREAEPAALGGSEPISSGFFFYYDEYVSSPYVVEQRSIRVYINGKMVYRASKKEPEDPIKRQKYVAKATARRAYYEKLLRSDSILIRGLNYERVLMGKKAWRLLEVLASDVSPEQKIATLRSDPRWHTTTDQRLCRTIIALGSNPALVLRHQEFLVRREEKERRQQLDRARADAESYMRTVARVHGGTHDSTPISDMEPEAYTPPHEPQKGPREAESPPRTAAGPIAEVFATYWLQMGLVVLIVVVAAAMVIVRSRRKRPGQTE